VHTSCLESLLISQMLYMLISTLYKRWNPSSLFEMRARIIIGEDKEATARHITELITQHGTKDWVGHAIDEAAPALFCLCEHVADTLEMMQKSVSLVCLFWYLLLTECQRL